MAPEKPLRAPAHHVSCAHHAHDRVAIHSLGPAHDELVMATAHTRLDRRIAEANRLAIELAQQQVAGWRLARAAVCRCRPCAELRLMAAATGLRTNEIVALDSIGRC